jgi:hypothetical protein
MCRGGKTLHLNLQEADEVHQMFWVNVTYVEACSSCCSEDFWHDYPIRRENNRILCKPFAAPSKWQLPSNHHNVPLIHHIVHTGENFFTLNSIAKMD